MQAKLQAPKGGCYSEENKEWYEGGQFLPSTCLPKGIVKKVKKALKNQSNISSLEVKQGVQGFCVKAVYTNNLNKSVILESFESKAEANTFVDALIEEKANQAKEQGFMPHPTQVVKL